MNNQNFTQMNNKQMKFYNIDKNLDFQIMIANIENFRNEF